MRQARWWLSVLIAFGALFGGWACGSSTEIPTVAEDPWATPEEEPEPEPDAGKPDAGPDISTFPPCGNGGKCNPNNLGGETCLGLGMGDGILACDAVTCTYDTSMCEGTGMGGNGGNGSVGVGNGNMGGGNGGGQNANFFGNDTGGTGGSGSGGSGGSGADSGNTPQFFGGSFFGDSDDEGSDGDQSSDDAAMDGGSRRR